MQLSWTTGPSLALARLSFALCRASVVVSTVLALPFLIGGSRQQATAAGDLLAMRYGGAANLRRGYLYCLRATARKAAKGEARGVSVLRSDSEFFGFLAGLLAARIFNVGFSKLSGPPHAAFTGESGCVCLRRVAVCAASAELLILSVWDPFLWWILVRAILASVCVVCW